MEITSSLSNEIARYLDLNTREIQLTAANMANIDTPGYRSVGMDFEAEMRRVMTGGEGYAGRAEAGIAPHVFEVDGLIVRPDGNNVSMDRESLNLAEAQLKFKTGVALLKGQYSGIMSAIHADSK
jgi:flagellar basal-body rod protein FlgB